MGWSMTTQTLVEKFKTWKANSSSERKDHAVCARTCRNIVYKWQNAIDGLRVHHEYIRLLRRCSIAATSWLVESSQGPQKVFFLLSGSAGKHSTSSV